MTHRVLAIAALLAAAGCSLDPDDSFVLDDNFGAISQASETPALYALGSQVRFEARRSLLDDEPVPRSWRLEVSNPEVIEVFAEEYDSREYRVRTVAAAPGVSTVSIFEGDRLRGETTVEVRAVARIELLDQALARAIGEERAIGAQIQLVAGSSTAAEVRYIDEGGNQLFGSGVIDWDEQSGVELWTDLQRFGRDREFLLISGDDSGDFAVNLRAGQAAVDALDIQFVDESVIDSVALIGDESGANDGQRICAAALAYDVNGDRVLGPPVAWSVEGTAIEGFGEPADLLCYTFRPDQEPQSVTARVGGEGLRIDIRGDEFETSSASNVGCSAGSGKSSLLWLFMVLGAVAALGRRKRSQN